MKYTKIMTIVLMLTSVGYAQKNEPQRQGPPMPHRPMPPPIMAALDADKDGTISADEIKNASNALAALDENGDGDITPDEAFGPRPHQGQSGEPGAGRPPQGEGRPPRDRRPQGPPPGVR